MKNVLTTYLVCLCGSNRWGIDIQEMQRLQQRFSTLLASPQPIDGMCLLFTDQELQAMNDALLGYMSLLCQVIPSSPQRDEVLDALQGLHQQFAAMLFPRLN
jgi:hypothetical protein